LSIEEIAGYFSKMIKKLLAEWEGDELRAGVTMIALRAAGAGAAKSACPLQ